GPRSSRRTSVRRSPRRLTPQPRGRSSPSASPLSQRTRAGGRSSPQSVKCGPKLIPQGVADLRRFDRRILVLTEKLVGVSRPVLHGARVLDVEVVAACLDVLDGHVPGAVVLFALGPPLLLRRELFNAKR